MKKIVGLLLCLAFVMPCYGADQWDKTDPAGTESPSDLDALITANNSAQDRVFSNYQRGMRITYASASSLSVAAGEITLSNSAGTTRLMQQNTSATTVTFSNIDTGSEAASTTYYLYAYQNTTSTSTVSFIVSASATSPTGATYFARLGSFYNDSSSDIDQYQITNDDISINWNEVKNGLKTYNSGWFAVSSATQYTKTHDLDTTNVLVSLFYSSSSDGADDFYGSGALSSWVENDQGAIMNGIAIDNLTTTQVRVVVGDQISVPNGGSDNTTKTSGYVRVILMALD